MRPSSFFTTILLLIFSTSFVFAGHGPAGAPPAEIPEGHVAINISGMITDSHSEPVNEAEISVFIDKTPVFSDTTAHGGKYLIRFACPEEALQDTTFSVIVRKASFATQSLQITADQFAHREGNCFITEDIVLPRHLGPAFWIATITFLAAYILISFELLHRTVAAMLGAALMLVISYTIGTINPEFRILSYEAAIGAIDMNVIFLLMGMMIIIGILKHTGVFQWCAYLSYKLARGNVFVLSVYLMIFTAVSSAFLDNVTTMLLLTGVAIEISLSLAINPLTLLVPLVLASNIGGTATLIGDPPNIMIGSYAGLTFTQFVVALALICVVSMVVLVIYTKLVWGREYKGAKIDNVEAYTRELKERYKITDATLLTYGLAILAFVVFLFLSHGFWHMEVSVAALIGASVFLTIALVTGKVNLLELIEKDIEWPTLMFFIFLFMLVGAVESSGLLALIADWILELSAGNFFVACSLIIWVAAIMSAFVDNIPFTATMLPIVAYLSTVIPGAENTLWWALALGACFGGNGTMIGASANVVTVGIAESRGYKISFLHFMKLAFPFMIISVVIAHAWLFIFRPV